jgi:hypothetical protein
LISAIDGFAAPPPPSNVIETDIVTISVEHQHEIVEPNSSSALAIHFKLKEDWHFYASEKTTPASMNLKIKPSAEKDYISFSDPIFPPPDLYFDKSSGKKLDVFSKHFTVFLPFTVSQTEFETGKMDVNVEIGIEGAVCSDVQCRIPDFKPLVTRIKIDSNVRMGEPKFVLPDNRDLWLVNRGSSDESVWFALGLALLAGLSLNIMPCVWPGRLPGHPPVWRRRPVEQHPDHRSSCAGPHDRGGPVPWLSAALCRHLSGAGAAARSRPGHRHGREGIPLWMVVLFALPVGLRRHGDGGSLLRSFRPPHAGLGRGG